MDRPFNNSSPDPREEKTTADSKMAYDFSTVQISSGNEETEPLSPTTSAFTGIAASKSNVFSMLPVPSTLALALSPASKYVQKLEEGIDENKAPACNDDEEKEEEEESDSESTYTYSSRYSPRKIIIGTGLIAIFGGTITFGASKSIQGKSIAAFTNHTYTAKASKAPKCPKTSTMNITASKSAKAYSGNATNCTDSNSTDSNSTDSNSTDSNSTDSNSTDNCTSDRNSTTNGTSGCFQTRLLSGVESSDSIYPKVRNLLSWILGIETMPGGAEDEEELIDVEEVEGSTIEHAVQDWTLERKCDVPELELSDNPAAWNYYDGLIEKNRNIASLARSVKEYAPKRGLVEDMIIDAELQEDDEDDEEVTNKDETQSFIPRRLLFTHKEDLLNCDVSSSEPSLHTMAHNVHDTIKAYSEVWGDDMEYDFLTDVECRKAIYETEPELLVYYDDLEGMFKGDICRSAYLYLNGGYYLDVDLLVVHPFVASPVNKFVTVKWAWYDKDKQFFQAFIAAAPRNEIIKKSLSIMLELLNGTRAKRGGGEMHMIGTQAMQDAWAELALDDASVASHGKNEEVYLLSEHRIGEYQGSSSYVKLPTQTNGGDAGYTDITCNFVVADDDEGSVYFFSHILGAEFCGKQL